MAITDLSIIRYEDINDNIRRYSHHAFLQSAQIRPAASRFHFDVARTILQAGNIHPHSAVPILEAVLLLHRGLAIHEDVDQSDELMRQLHVLAGDYCSSQYYWVIARTGNERLLQALSDSVVCINEAKMTLQREQSHLTADEYISLQETIHGDLLFTLARFFLPGESGWLAQFRFAVRAYVVRTDVEQAVVPRHFTLKQAFEWLSDSKDRLLLGPSAAIIPPVSNIILDSWNVLRGLVEKQSFAEGNR